MAPAADPSPVSGHVGALPADGAVEPVSVSVEPAGEPAEVPGEDAAPAAEPTVEHVPIKKKGSRKR
ncbi:hypothetical protein [Nocardioides sp. YIM 152588]|uniref:hypothetical protein n=1 Tax=Nocardioides sp. YIM 152588 TaxID=3158259 RepID=UPI0032E41F80